MDASPSPSRYLLNSPLALASEGESSHTVEHHPTPLPPVKKTSFATQANALLRKNLAFQKRRTKSNCCLVLSPISICVMLMVFQKLIESWYSSRYHCGCKCISKRADGTCAKEECGLEHSKYPTQFPACPFPSPPEWHPTFQVPRPEFRATTGNHGRDGLPNKHCLKDGSCPATLLFTGRNRSLMEDLADKFFSALPVPPPENVSTILSTLVLGSDTYTERENFIEPSYHSERPLYGLQTDCRPNSSFPLPIEIIKKYLPKLSVDLKCVQALSLWRESSSAVNDELYEGYRQSNNHGRINEIMAAYDFLDTGNSKFNVRIWYNSTYNDDIGNGPLAQVRVVQSVNLISNAYVKRAKGPGFDVKLDFIKEMPKPLTKMELEFSSMLGPLLFTLVIELIFYILLTDLVYEKQYNMRIMMKMHGLGDGPYLMITYAYFLLISVIYVLFLVVFGSAIGLDFFRMQEYSLQCVFYISFINLQIALAFFVATFLKKVNGARVIALVYIIVSTILGESLFVQLLNDLKFSRSWIRVMELLPAFSLYRGLYEFAEYASNGKYMSTSGMRWKNLNDEMNGMKEVLIIMTVEYILFLLLTYYMDQLSSKGSRMRKNPLSLLPCLKKKVPLPVGRTSLQRQTSKVFVDVDKQDVAQEREVVEQLRPEPSSYAIVSDDLKKVYPGRDGNPDKLAVQGLSLAVPRSECFGMLGPNGAGKTTFINMMTGLTTPSSGNAYVEGNNIQTEMDEIYTSMGVCLQHDMLWEMLTAKEHLLFYGRLKNLKGAALDKAVEESLKSVNLFHGGAGNKQAKKYSGGMKRRLSVAISLIGNPKVVYMDEPSTGLDPASRNNLWNVIKDLKKDRAIILTTHSMEEAEVLCDRLGIFVGGALQCIGNPKQLKARYGDTYVLTITTSPEEEQNVENLTRALSCNAKKIYHIPGTQKFEISKQDVNIADVFNVMEEAKRRLPIRAWELANTTLEDVFIKVAQEASSNHELP